MASWSEFAAASPALAGAVRDAIFQYGSGLAYLGTVRPDGGPRIHPVSPAIVGGRLYCCLIDSPKRRDLDRDRRFALHAFPSDVNDDEVSLRGRARPIVDPATVRQVAAQMRADAGVDWWLYEMGIEAAHVVRREGSSARTDRWIESARLARAC